MEGCFALLNNNTGNFTVYNLKRYRDSAFLPASTFKIVNSLIGLQTGIIDNDSMVIKWDGKVRRVPEWNQDLSMDRAFRVSAVPYFQEVARRIGKDTMQQWLDTLHYGTTAIKTKIDTFWLDNSLKFLQQPGSLFVFFLLLQRVGQVVLGGAVPWFLLKRFSVFLFGQVELRLLVILISLADMRIHGLRMGRNRNHKRNENKNLLHNRVYPYFFHYPGGNFGRIRRKMNIRYNRSRVSPAAQFVLYGKQIFGFSF